MGRLKKQEVPVVDLRCLRRVYTPSGWCPIDIEGKVTVEKLLNWAIELRKMYLAKNEYLEIEAILYWIRMEQVDENEHPRVFANIEKALRDNLETYDQFMKRVSG